MGLSALAMFTHGWHHPGLVEVEVCETPLLSAVLEVRPTIREVTAPPPPTGDEAPVVVSTEEVKPEMRSVSSPRTSAGEEPAIISTEEVRPIITSVKED